MLKMTPSQSANEKYILKQLHKVQFVSKLLHIYHI